jgi:ABC-2 type transport system permease protein
MSEATIARTTTPTGASGERGNDLALLWRQFVAEVKMLLRNPASIAFTIIFPVMFLVIFGSLAGGGGSALSDTTYGQMRFIDYYLPGIATFGVIAACFMNLAMVTVNRRDDGVLRRKRGTPLPTWALIGGIVLAETLVSVVMVAVTTAVAVLFYGTAFPRHPLELLGVVILGAGCFCALGLLMTVVVPNQDAGPAVVNFVVFPLLFLSGVFFPVTNRVLRTIAQILPIARLQDAMVGAYAPDTYSCDLVKGHCRDAAARAAHLAGPGVVEVLVIAAWLVVGVVLAIRFFRWESKVH